MPVIPATWEADAGESEPGGAKVAVSRDRAIALQPERNSVSEKEKFTHMILKSSSRCVPDGKSMCLVPPLRISALSVISAFSVLHI